MNYLHTSPSSLGLIRQAGEGAGQKVCCYLCFYLIIFTALYGLVSVMVSLHYRESLASPDQGYSAIVIRAS